MYANLKVTVTAPDGTVEEFAAWRVKVLVSGVVVVHLDDTDDESGRPAPAGVRLLAADHAVSIEADF